MTWHLESVSHVEYRRNPLAAVIAQVRFHPVLKISDRIPEIQDRVRALFPLYKKERVREVRTDAEGLEFREDDQFEFISEDESTSVKLVINSLTLLTRSYVHHEDFLGKFREAYQALLDLCSPLAIKRLGLRYVNSINRADIAASLRCELEWKDLVSEAFLQMPSGLADLDQTRFVNEITSPLGRGALTLRYGILETGGREHFRLDMDRYSTEKDLSPAVILDGLQGFSDDCYYLFSATVGEKLKGWMTYQDG